MKIAPLHFVHAAVLAALLLAATSVQACPKTHCVRAGSWNIEWLGSDKRPQPVDAKTIDAMATLLADELSIDIISLEEINTELDGTVQGEAFSLAPWQQLQAALQKKGYQVQAGSSGYAQHVVLAWRAPVKVLEKPSDIDIPDTYKLNQYCRSSRLRKPLGGFFKAGQFDFWFIGVHLKSSTDSNECSNDIRSAQVNALLPALTRLEKHDADIILAGDFNASGKHKSLAQLLASGFDVTDEKNRRNPASNSHSYHSEKSKKGSSGSLIDHIMIRSGFTTEWEPYSTTVYKPKDAAAFARTYSDHLPVWADFSTARDDD